MKRQYVVPGITIERYAKTQSIMGCITKIGALGSECVLKDSDATDFMKYFAEQGYFTDSFSCHESFGEFELEGFDTICYHTNVKQAFAS